AAPGHLEQTMTTSIDEDHPEPGQSQDNHSAARAQGCVFLVGAGPGDPGLLTLRAIECLAAADLIIYDKLVPLRLLDWAAPGAELLCVSDLAGCHPERWPHIHRAMID